MECLILRAYAPHSRVYARLISAIHALQVAGIVPEKSATTRNISHSTTEIRIPLYLPELRRRICLFSVQQELLHVIVATFPAALSLWLSLILQYVTASGATDCLLLERGADFAPSHTKLRGGHTDAAAAGASKSAPDPSAHRDAKTRRNMLALLLQLDAVQMKIVATLVLWSLIGLTGSYSLHLPQNIVDEGCDVMSCIRHLIDIELLVCCGDLNAVIADSLPGNGIVVHHLQNVEVASHLLAFVKDACVLMFGCGFGSSMVRSLWSMSLGLARLTTFPFATQVQPYTLFPHPVAWMQYKAARVWQKSLRDAVVEATNATDPWPIRRFVAQIVQRCSRETTATDTPSAFRWRVATTPANESEHSKMSWGPSPLPAAKGVPAAHTYTLPFGDPPTRPLPTHAEPLQRIAAQAVYAQEFMQMHSNPVVIYVAGLLEAAIAYRHVGTQMLQEMRHHAARFVDQDSDWWENITLEHLHRDVNAFDGTLPSDNFPQDPRAVLFEAARLLYFVTRLPRLPTFSDEIQHIGYKHYSSDQNATITKQSEPDVVPGVAAGIKTLLPVVWEELLLVIHKLGARRLLISVGKEALTYFEHAQLHLKAAAVLTTLQQQHTSLVKDLSTPPRIFESPLRPAADVCLKELRVVSPRWPTTVTPWSPSSLSTPLEDMGIRDAAGVLEHATAEARARPSEWSVGSCDDVIALGGKIPFKRGRSHVYHIDAQGSPASVEEVVLQVFTLEQDVLEQIIPQESVDMFLDAGGVVRLRKQHSSGLSGMKRQRSDMSSDIICFPRAYFETSRSSVACSGLFGHPEALNRLFRGIATAPPNLVECCDQGYIPYPTLAAVATGISADNVYRLDTLVGQMTPRLRVCDEIIYAHGNGWRGAHSENVFWCTLFGILIWEAMGPTPPGKRAAAEGAGAVPKASNTPAQCTMGERLQRAWKHPWQSTPLDMYFDDMYQNRKAIIEEHFDSLESMSCCEFAGYLKRVYNEHCGSLGFRIRWDLFEVEDLCEIVHAAGPSLICAVLRQLAGAYQSNFCGLPDIILWRPLPCKHCQLGVAGLDWQCRVSMHPSRQQLVFHGAQTTGDRVVIDDDAVQFIETLDRLKSNTSAAPNPCFVFLEVKSTKDKVQPHQLAWFRRIKQRAHLAVVHVNAPAEDT